MELSVEATKLQYGCQARRGFSNLDLQNLTLNPLNPQLNPINPKLNPQ